MSFSAAMVVQSPQGRRGRRLPGRGFALAVVVLRVAVGEAVVPAAVVAPDLDHLLLLALPDGAALVEHLPPLLGRVGLALGVDVARHGQVGRVAPLRNGNGALAQRTDWNLQKNKRR